LQFSPTSLSINTKQILVELERAAAKLSNEVLGRIVVMSGGKLLDSLDPSSRS
jgi:hypothetical protein